MKAAKDREEDFCDPARKDNILGRNKTRLELWEEHLKEPIVALDKALKCVEDQHHGEVVAGIKEKASAPHGVKEAAQRSVGQCIVRRWDCSQFQNEEEEERWQERDRLAPQRTSCLGQRP